MSNVNKYTVGSNACVLGTFLHEVCTPQQQYIIETFFQPSLDGWVEEEKGYDEIRWAFEDKEGRLYKGYDEIRWAFEDKEGRLYNCYRRHGSMRVGAHEGTPVKEFLSWIDDYRNNLDKMSA
jgi:hypothetical protein